MYKGLLVENLVYFQREKGLEIYSWCSMSGHVNLITGKNGVAKIEEIIRDFKKCTSVACAKQLKKIPGRVEKMVALDV